MNLTERVKDCIMDRMIDYACKHDVSITDLMGNYDCRVKNLKAADRYMRKYANRESRLYVKAWRGVLKDYE